MDTKDKVDLILELSVSFDLKDDVRINVIITRDKHMKVIEKLVKKHHKHLISYDHMTSDIFFRGKKQIIDKIKRELDKHGIYYE